MAGNQEVSALTKLMAFEIVNRNITKFINMFSSFYSNFYDEEEAPEEKKSSLEKLLFPMLRECGDRTILGCLSAYMPEDTKENDEKIAVEKRERIAEAREQIAIETRQILDSKASIPDDICINIFSEAECQYKNIRLIHAVIRRFNRYPCFIQKIKIPEVNLNNFKLFDNGQINSEGTIIKTLEQYLELEMSGTLYSINQFSFLTNAFNTALGDPDFLCFEVCQWAWEKLSKNEEKRKLIEEGNYTAIINCSYGLNSLEMILEITQGVGVIKRMLEKENFKCLTIAVRTNNPEVVKRLFQEAENIDKQEGTGVIFQVTMLTKSGSHDAFLYTLDHACFDSYGRNEMLDVFFEKMCKLALPKEEMIEILSRAMLLVIQLQRESTKDKFKWCLQKIKAYDITIKEVLSCHDFFLIKSAKERQWLGIMLKLVHLEFPDCSKEFEKGGLFFDQIPHNLQAYLLKQVEEQQTEVIDSPQDRKNNDQQPSIPLQSTFNIVSTPGFFNSIKSNKGAFIFTTFLAGAIVGTVINIGLAIKMGLSVNLEVVGVGAGIGVTTGFAIALVIVLIAYRCAKTISENRSVEEVPILASLKVEQQASVK